MNEGRTMAKKKVVRKEELGTDLTTRGFDGLHVNMPAKISPTELALPDGLERQEWEETVFKIAQVNGASNWWLGDALVYGETRYGEQYAQGASDTCLSPDKIKAALYVSLRVAPVRRINNPIVSWSHHREVAKCTDKEQTDWLERSLKNEWSLRELKEAMRKKGHKNAKEPKGGEPENADEGLCAICESAKGKLKICSKCLKVASDTDSALSGPQADLAVWAFQFVVEPAEFADDEEKLDWGNHYRALKKLAAKQKKAA
jgi:hypothetical protein